VKLVEQRSSVGTVTEGYTALQFGSSRSKYVIPSKIWLYLIARPSCYVTSISVDLRTRRASDVVSLAHLALI
jgi:hypothetical protein